MWHLKWSNCGKSKEVNTDVFTDNGMFFRSNLICDSVVVLSGAIIRLSNHEVRHFLTKYTFFSLLYLRGTICD